MKHRLACALWMGCIAMPMASVADEVTDQIQSAIEAYEQQDYRAAVDDLNYVIAQIQELINSQNSQLFPEPLEGWTASEVENTSGAVAMLGGGTNMTRRYERDGESIEIGIMANSPWIVGMMQMIGNPMLMAGNPATKPYRYKDLKGMKEVGDGSLEVTLMPGGQILVKLTGQGLKDETAIEQYLAAMDFDRIQAALQ